MHIKTYKTHPITANEDLLGIIDAYIPKLNEQSILVITSKIISLCEGSIINKMEVSSKEALIRESADAYLDDKNEHLSLHSIQLTIKNNILIPSAGIDESNGNDVYILYPQNVQQTASVVWEHLRKRDDLNELGVLITDSHTTPLRRGVIGIGLGWCGFKPLSNYIGQLDCFGHPLRFTMANHVDALAASAVFCMGEGSEQTPFAVIEETAKIEFQPSAPTDLETQQISIPIDEDLYAPLLKNIHWISKL
ncbi:MAG TPA: coenzyme F420-0:L-glutamate ligase [Chlamydiales bacterium]|nr:coenzyme F420-0:L-glutamate ligase [Chlamydiales bacterium]